jgi:hypothetical protein
MPIDVKELEGKKVSILVAGKDDKTENWQGILKKDLGEWIILENDEKGKWKTLRIAKSRLYSILELTE